MPFFSRFKNKGAQPTSKDQLVNDLTNGKPTGPQKLKWESSWNSKTIVPEEVEELVHTCTAEMKSRAEALDAPFFLLPFRLETDPSGARSFIRNFYMNNQNGSDKFRGRNLQQELRLTEPIVLCSIMKWCWSRMPGGVVTWPVYEGFQIGERESNMARNAFETFVPISVDTPARKNIIFDFFDLMAAVAAHGKMNGLGGRKLSRLAGWWAFEHSDDGKGFEGGYKSWTAAADASSHLFFAYLRSLSPEEQAMSLIERIPRSLQALLASTEYPPERPTLMQRHTPRVVMIVDTVSPTPFSLLRRAKHFEYRDNDRILREYSEFEDPLDGLTDECKRVLYAISSTNSSAARSRHRNAVKPDESWSQFQNMGFADLDERSLNNAPNGLGSSGENKKPQSPGMRSEPRSRNADHGRPTTPSWADFLSSGFPEDDAGKTSATLLLPPDKVLPPITSRAQTPAYSVYDDDDLKPGELAAIANVDLDDAFWWVWMTSLAGEEPAERKAVFGRCAVIETTIMNGKWLIMEEQVKGASPDPVEGAYIAKKKNFFTTFTKRGKLSRKKSTGKSSLATPEKPSGHMPHAAQSRASLAPDQQSKIKQAAAALKNKDLHDAQTNRRGRNEDGYSTKTHSVLTTGLQSEAGPAMKWTTAYDRDAIRREYLGDSFAGRGISREDLMMSPVSSQHVNGTSGVSTPVPAARPEPVTVHELSSERELPSPPRQEPATPVARPVELAPTVSERALEVDETSAGAERIDNDSVDDIPAPAPVASAMDKELGVDAPPSPNMNRLSRKPVPRTNDHPAYRVPTNESPEAVPQTPTSPTQNVAAIAAAKAMQTANNNTSPESIKSDRTKLKKQPPGGSSAGGFKKLFGRKKDSQTRPSGEVTRATNNNLAPPADSNVGRRLSLLRKKPAPPSKEVAAVPYASASELEGDPVTPNSHDEPATDVTNSPDPQYAEDEFARFDQGGPVSMPSDTPHTSEPDIVAPQAQRSFKVNNVNEHLAAKVEQQDEHDNHVEHDDPIDDAQSETTMEDHPAPVPEKETADRWAIIRENAARRAARASEEQGSSAQSRPSQSQRTDDGETSGEETIESRVARIKARVAELTGGMDSSTRR